MSQTIDEAKHILLEPTGLDPDALTRVLGQLVGNKVDQADLYFQMAYSESWSMEDSKVKDASFSIDKGVGVRAISGEKTGFAYSDEIVMPALEQAAHAARSIARTGQGTPLKVWTEETISKAHYPAVNPLDTLSKQDKIDILQRIDAMARQHDPKIKEVIASLAAQYEVILVMDKLGQITADIRPLVRLNVRVIAEHNGRREVGSSGGGGRSDYSIVANPATIEEYTHDAVRQALLLLDAKQAPAGVMPVVLGPGWPGVLLHEAVGHGLEGDFNRKGSSAFSGRMGQQVASPLVTVVDNGAMDKRRGSLTIDDEGTPTQCTTLIENGILKNYMQDKHNARLMGMEATGNGRRESYAHLPMPRMTNTYMLAGESDPSEIIASVKKGLYAVNFAGGQVDITSGQFVFSASEAYMIENGKITYPVKGATLIGNGPDAMNKVSMVGNDLALDKGIGVCGKDGQSVPVGVGQPTLKVDELTVGGTSA